MYDIGERIAGKYRVGRKLGEGGMGVVVAAEHEELRAPVALKFLAPELARRGDVVERFLREARVCARLRSEHVCRVSDFGRADGGVPYIVMELLEGCDLASVLRGNGPLPLATAVDYIVQACDAVAEAHDANIVHRDLKPANLFLARRRDGGALIKVLDFGVAKIREPGEHVLTQTDLVVGSPAYMAPEQVYSALAADARSDVWSLGVILYEMVTGRPPFVGPAVDIAHEIGTRPAPRLIGVPDEFADVVARCLARMPEDRFQSIGALVGALRRFLPDGAGFDAAATMRSRPVALDARERSTIRMTPVELRALPPSPMHGVAALPSMYQTAMIGPGGGYPMIRRAETEGEQPVRARRARWSRGSWPVDWKHVLPLAWQTPRRSTAAGTVAATLFCILLGMILSVGLARCTHARGSEATGSLGARTAG